MLIKAGIGAVMTAAIVGTTLQIALPPRPKILYNPSSSAPIGWYQLTDNYSPKRNDLVAAYAPDWARILADERSYLPYEYPLIKSVLAIEGDEVCYHIDRVSVPNGSDIPLLARDRLGREMPNKFIGCLTLGAGELWIASPDVQAGFDSRYFGPIEHNMLIGGVEYLGNGKVPKRRKSVGFEG
jgi:type IV secretory pathway protease TraF